ncbi:putative ribonuclease H-like domain-containing protein [Tanacetum coccineum]
MNTNNKAKDKRIPFGTSTNSQPEIDRNKVIIEDWVDSDDEETVLNSSEIQKEIVLNLENSETSFENKSPSNQNSVGQGSRKTGLGHKWGKLCFVCYSPDHLIKDCNLHARKLKQTQNHKSKGTQGSRGTRPVWNNTNRVNHRNFSSNYRYPHQRRSFIPSAVLTREGLKSTARPRKTQTVPSKSTANVFYQGTARPRVPHAVLSRSTGRPYYPRMDNRRPRTSSYSPSSRFSTTRTPYRPHRPKKIVKSIWVKKGSTVGSQAVLPQNVKESAMINSKQTWRPKGAYLDSVNRDNGSYTLKQFEYGNPEEDLKDYAIIDSGCSGSMTGDKDKLSDFKEFKGGYVAFGNDSKGGRISGKGTIKTSCLDFEKVSYVEELKFNLLSVSQICDKKHNVLFTDKECLILSPKFKFVDEDLVILRAPRKNDVYSLDLKNIIPSGGVTCLVAKATNDEVVLWHRRLGHVNLKNINKLVQGNLVRGLPSKTFKIDHSCLACNKGKQHRASCKKVKERTIREPLELLHMDLFGPVSVESINKKKYCLVVTDDCSKFSWVFFLAYKDETYDMLHDLIVGLENRLRHKVKTIRCDNGTEFKNQLMNEFCAKKGIKRDYSICKDLNQPKYSSLFMVQAFMQLRPMHSEEGTADKEVPLSFEEQALHNELMRLMHQVISYKTHNDAQRLLLKKRRGNSKDHPQSQFIGKSTAGVLTRRKLKESDSVQHQALLGTQNVSQALIMKIGVKRCNERRMLQFKLQDVWVLCDLPDGKQVIGTKWVFRNKRDERGTIIKNKARLVAQGYRQEEGVDYDEVFAQLPKLKQIRLFFGIASLWGFTVYRWMSKVAFFIWQHHRRGVCKTASRSTKTSMVKDFEDLMQKEFKMSSMGELTFFLGLQVKQTTAGIFLSQDKYVKDILNKFDFRTIKPASTPIEAHKSLVKDEEGEDVDVHLYRSMIVVSCIKLLQVRHNVCCLSVVPIQALKEAFSDSDYVGDNHDRRSTSGGCQYLRVSGSLAMQETNNCGLSSTRGEYVSSCKFCVSTIEQYHMHLYEEFLILHSRPRLNSDSTSLIRDVMSEAHYVVRVVVDKFALEVFLS